jgi:hypothetical protein
LAAGAALYFALPVEPHGAIAVAAASLALGLVAAIRRGAARRWLLIAFAPLVSSRQARTVWLDTPTLPP